MRQLVDRNRLFLAPCEQRLLLLPVTLWGSFPCLLTHMYWAHSSQLQISRTCFLSSSLLSSTRPCPACLDFPRCPLYCCNSGRLLDYNRLCYSLKSSLQVNWCNGRASTSLEFYLKIVNFKGVSKKFVILITLGYTSKSVLQLVTVHNYLVVVMKWKLSFQGKLFFLILLFFHCRAPSMTSKLIFPMFMPNCWNPLWQVAKPASSCVSSLVRYLFCWPSWVGWLRWAALPWGP